jgi:tetratricopeptide (TPR) repeat protein
MSILPCTAWGGESTARLKELAAQYEKEALPKEAAEVYEAILGAEPTATRVITPKLVRLYVQSEQPGKAMDKAREFMNDTPDPQAYLAGVYTMVGGYREAEVILREAIGSEKKHTRRRIMLHWQLSDLYVKSKRLDMAEKTLVDMLKLEGNAGHEKVTAHKLEIIHKKKAEAGGGARSGTGTKAFRRHHR